MSIDLRVIANTLDNRQIAANGQFTTDSPQRSETLMTLSQTSDQVTVPRVRVGITVFCIVTLPRDRLGITAREVKLNVTFLLGCRELHRTVYNLHIDGSLQNVLL